MLFLLHKDISMEPKELPENTDIATFAGGCFWCMQPPYEKLNGVKEVVSGYIGGSNPNPIYENFAQHGHKEAVQITFDPAIISYQKLLDIFWQNIDPTDAGGQFADRGQQYQTAIFYHNDEQRTLAQESIKQLAASRKFSQPIATQLIKASPFYPAEDYHQAFYKKNPEHYASYSHLSGRKPFLEETWGNDNDEV